MKNFEISNRNKIFRALWNIAYFVFFRYSPTPFFKYRILILKAFGAKCKFDARVYPSARIWNPKNLVMGKNSCIGQNVIVYNVDLVTLNSGATVSQNSHLCTASHDYNKLNHQLVIGPITLSEKSWVSADCFVGPDVTISKFSVCLARSVVVSDTIASGVYAGNPAKLLKERSLLS